MDERGTAALWAALERADERDREMLEILVESRAKLESMEQALHSAADGPGFIRCERREARIAHLESRLDQHLGRLWWMTSTAIAAVISLGLKTLWEAIHK